MYSCILDTVSKEKFNGDLIHFDEIMYQFKFMFYTIVRVILPIFSQASCSVGPFVYAHWHENKQVPKNVSSVQTERTVAKMLSSLS